MVAITYVSKQRNLKIVLQILVKMLMKSRKRIKTHTLPKLLTKEFTFQMEVPTTALDVILRNATLSF